jgi:hypothetical protein
MATTQQAIMKAVERPSTALGLELTFPSDPDLTIYPSQELFPNVLALAADLNDQLVTATAGYLAGSTHLVFNTNNGLIRFRTYTAGIFTNPSVTASFPSLGFLQASGGDTGSTGTINGLTGSWWNAAEPPRETFLPNYYTSDAWYFVDDADEVFRGVTGVDGNLSGTNFTPRAKRNLEWRFQTSTNALKNDPNATLEQSRKSFENVINTARENRLTLSTDNTYCKGVYFIDDISVYYADGTTIDKFPTSWGSGSTTGDYIFCSAGKPNIIGASINNTKNWYDCSVELTTAVSPAWTWSI